MSKQRERPIPNQCSKDLNMTASLQPIDTPPQLKR